MDSDQERDARKAQLKMLQFARQYHQKFGFYTTALTFTVLAASIHAAPQFLTWMDGVGWIALLLAGLAGLAWLFCTTRVYYGLAGLAGSDPRQTSISAAVFQYAHLASLAVGLTAQVAARLFEWGGWPW